MTDQNKAHWPFDLLSGALAVVAIVVPRLPGIRPTDVVAGGIRVGPFSGGLIDANTLVMSVLLLSFAAVVTAIRPWEALRRGITFGLTPMVWMAAVMVLHGPGDIWPIALVLTLGYGAVIASVGVAVGKFFGWLFHIGIHRRAV